MVDLERLLGCSPVQAQSGYTLLYTSGSARAGVLGLLQRGLETIRRRGSAAC